MSSTSRGSRPHGLFASSRAELQVIALGGTLVLGLVVGFAFLAGRADYDTWGPILIACVLAALAVPIVLSTARRSDDPLAARLLAWGFAAKMAGGLTRYWVNRYVYDESADAGVYHETGRVLAVAIRNGVWSLDDTLLQFRPQETQAVGWVTGTLYSVTGASELGGYLLFSFISWCGMICFYRAFRLAFPDVSSRPALLLLFFLPSIVYWPSSQGKEALVVGLLGVLTLGVTHVLSGSSPWLGLAQILVAMPGIMRLRPHVAMLVLVGLAVAVLVRRPGTGTAANRAGRLLLLVLLVPVLFVGLGRIDSAFGEQKSESPTLSGVFERTADQTSTGNSSFDARPVRSPLDLPGAVVSVLLRPFVWEASSLPMAIAALEGVLLVFLLASNAGLLGRLGHVVRTSPLGAFCAVYCLAFVIAFSNVANAGILVRQRTQVFPFVMILLAAAYAVQPGVSSTAGPVDRASGMRSTR